MRLQPLLVAAFVPVLVSAAPTAKPRLPAPAAGPATGRVCPEIKPHVAKTGVRLFDGPAGAATFDLHQAILRRVDGCVVPAILRRDVDGRGDASDKTEGGRAPTLVRPL